MPVRILLKIVYQTDKLTITCNRKGQRARHHRSHTSITRSMILLNMRKININNRVWRLNCRAKKSLSSSSLNQAFLYCKMIYFWKMQNRLKSTLKRGRPFTIRQALPLGMEVTQSIQSLVRRKQVLTLTVPSWLTITKIVALTTNSMRVYALKINARPSQTITLSQIRVRMTSYLAQMNSPQCISREFCNQTKASETSITLTKWTQSLARI